MLTLSDNGDQHIHSDLYILNGKTLATFRFYRTWSMKSYTSIKANKKRQENLDSYINIFKWINTYMHENIYVEANTNTYRHAHIHGHRYKVSYDDSKQTLISAYKHLWVHTDIYGYIHTSISNADI